MNCEEFEAWLDAGPPASKHGEASVHSAACAACGRAARAAGAIESLLRQPPSPAPQDFTAHVMARIAATPAPGNPAEPARLGSMPPRLDFVRRFAVEPATMFAIACGTVAIVLPSIVSRPGLDRSIATPLLRLLAEAGRSTPMPTSDGARAALEAIALLAATALGVGLARWTARAAGPPLHAKPRR